jgi:iron(III) transport system permease protein
MIPSIRSVTRLGAVVVVTATAAAVTVPIVILVILSLQTATTLGSGHFTFGNYVALLHQTSLSLALRNTIVFTAGATVLAVILGTAMAWAITSVNVPGRAVLRVLPLCGLILPPLLKDPAWIILFSRKTGLVNIFLRDVFGLQLSFINVFTMIGMITVAGVFAAPIAYIIMLAPFEGLDRAIVDASRTSGARLNVTLFRVVVPMIWPALLSSITLLVIVLASSFETPIIIGYPAGITTYMSQIYQLVNTPILGLNVAAAQGSLYVILTGVLVVCYVLATRKERKFVAISGRGHSHDVTRAPVLRWVLFAFIVVYSTLGFIAPLVITALTSFLPFYSAVNGNPFKNFTSSNYDDVFTTSSVVSGIETSAILALAVSAGVIALGGLLSYISLKSTSRFRRACEFIAMAPIAIPALVYSVGLLLTVLSIPGLARIAYGSKGVMFAGEVVVFLPLAVRLLASALIQVQDELLEASRLSGAGVARTIRSVIIPILRPAILYTGAIVFVLSYRELAAVVFLVAANTQLVPYLSFSFLQSGGYPMLAALNMVMLAPPLIVICLAFAFAKERRMRRGRPVHVETAVRPQLIVEAN